MAQCVFHINSDFIFSLILISHSTKYIYIVLNFYYSKDCVNWGLLPPATKAMREKSKLAKGRFTGDASHEFEHVQTKKSGDGDDAHEEEETVGN